MRKPLILFGFLIHVRMHVYAKAYIEKERWRLMLKHKARPGSLLCFAANPSVQTFQNASASSRQDAAAWGVQVSGVSGLVLRLCGKSKAFEWGSWPLAQFCRTCPKLF